MRHTHRITRNTVLSPSDTIRCGSLPSPRRRVLPTNIRAFTGAFLWRRLGVACGLPMQSGRTTGHWSRQSFLAVPRPNPPDFRWVAMPSCSTTRIAIPLLGPNIGGVFFHDMGNVYSTIGDYRSVGNSATSRISTTWFTRSASASVIGPRSEPFAEILAYSLNPPSYLGFSGTPEQLIRCDPESPIGDLPSFCQSTRQNVGHFQFFFSIGQTF